MEIKKMVWKERIMLKKKIEVTISWVKQFTTNSQMGD